MMFGFLKNYSSSSRSGQAPSKVPLLVYTDLKVVDENLNVQHESMIRTQSDHANTELIQELTENTVTGGVAMINHAWRNYGQVKKIMHSLCMIGI